MGKQVAAPPPLRLHPGLPCAAAVPTMLGARRYVRVAAQPVAAQSRPKPPTQLLPAAAAAATCTVARRRRRGCLLGPWAVGGGPAPRGPSTRGLAGGATTAPAGSLSPSLLGTLRDRELVKGCTDEQAFERLFCRVAQQGGGQGGEGGAEEEGAPVPCAYLGIDPTAPRCEAALPQPARSSSPAGR
eukprot:SAG25_NODE_706_length_5833_cov_3.268875_3_plen_186_part_00